MFYGRTGGEFGKGGAQKRNDRYDQMTRQQELIEQKKREIQMKIEAEKKQKEMEMTLKKSGASKSTGRGVSSSASSATNKSQQGESSDRKSSTPLEDKKPMLSNIFSNDGSFMEQFKRMQEQKKKEEAKKKVTVKEEPEDAANEYGTAGAAKVPSEKKPTIKILNVPPRNSSPAQESTSTNSSASRNSMSAVPPPTFNQYPPPNQATPQSVESPPRHEEKYFPRGGYQNVPPPPPPPPPPPSHGHQHPGGFPSQVVRQLAKDIAEGGDHIEDMARVENQDDPLMWFLYRPDSGEYKRYRELVNQLRLEFQRGPQPRFSEPKRKVDSSSSGDEYGGNREQDEYGGRTANRTKKRRSRWAPESDSNSMSAPESNCPPMFNPNVQGPAGMPFRSETPPGLGFAPGPMFNNPPPGEGPGMGGPFNPGLPGSSVMSHGAPPPIMGIGQGIPSPNMGMTFPPGQFMTTPPPPPPPPGGPSNISPWGIKEEELGPPNMGFPGPSGFSEFLPAPSSSSKDVNLSKVTRQNPQLLSYAQGAYGTTELDEEQWKQCEEAYKMKLVYQDIAKKKARDEKLEAAGKFKHEYDSDEDIDGGTWEHKQRMKEMEKTKIWATELTSKAKGKHHIGDFLPPDELNKFMEKYKSVKEGKPFDDSDYQEAKITETNVGFKMLQKMGWTDGQGLGSTGQGITAPIDKGNAVSDKQGLGVEKPGDLNEEDDEYTAYRKRMMLAYRFRPNPLNNPRRAYY